MKILGNRVLISKLEEEKKHAEDQLQEKEEAYNK